METIKPQSTPLKVNEILLRDNGEWLFFCRPRQVVIAEKLADVVPALREIEQLIQRHNLYAAGFLSYEAASAFGPELKTHAVHSPRNADGPGTEDDAKEDRFPYVWFGIYPKPLAVSLPRPAEIKQKLNWGPTVDRETYNAAIAQIRDHIAEGRTYQVNYTMQLQTDFKGNTWDFFLHLAQHQNEQAAYVDTGRFIVCSASPELFFQLDGRTITGRPMKGTVKRGRTTTEDHEQAAWLRDSEKNRAENVMIVDMLRNDLGRIAESGSVRVPELFALERYPTLWQMTSTVTAQTSASLTEIFSALFPCASITGAPKVSTMKIISELERLPRKVYTGSIGYISPEHKAKFNVAIRTALIDRETCQARYGVGGGIVWDSTSADEYEEALLKAHVLTEESGEFSLLETMLWTPEAGFFLRERHLARMLDSADYFGISTSREMLEGCLDQISHRFCSALRVRLMLDQMGVVHVDSKPHRPRETDRPLKVHLAKGPVNSGNIFLFHKTTRRDIYEAAQRAFPQYHDVLLYNQAGELTEFTIGNLVVELDGELSTPPISCGVLAGTFRAHLLESGQVTEKIIPLDKLGECTKIFRVNSIRKWQAVQIKE